MTREAVMTRRATILGLVAAVVAMPALALRAPALAQGLPPGFVHLSAVAPSIRQDIRYAGSRNFIGRPLAGYEAGECILTVPAAEALRRAQAEIAARGLTLVVWDCYRPQRAVADMVAWTRDAGDLRMRAIYYPDVDKRDLARLGYLSPRSAHSRGSTVDLGLARPGIRPGGGAGACAAPVGQRIDDGALDFGTAYDCFDPRSGAADPRVSREARANRQVLAGLMRRHGFRGYAREWWHFQFAAEPFPTQSFDFPVRRR